MKRSTLVLLVLATAVGGGIASQLLRPKAPILVVTASVERLPRLRSLVSATGEIRAKEFVDIQAEVAGLILELRVREGDDVAAGDVLLRLDDRQYRADVDAAAAQVGAAEADARQAEVGIATAEANLAGERTALASAGLEVEQAQTSSERAAASFRRKQELHEQGLIGAEEFEIAAADARLADQRLTLSRARIDLAEANIRAATTRVDAARAMLEAACKRIDAAKAALLRATDLADRTVLRAPLAGRVTKLNVEQGERAVPGIQSNPVATLMTIANLATIEAEIRVAEADIVGVELGAPAEIEVDAIRDTRFAGVVTEIGQSPIQTAAGGSGQDGKEFLVVVRLTAPAPALRPGFTATAEITTAVREDVLVIPFQAQTAREVELDEQGRYVPPPEPQGEVAELPLTAAERQRRKERKGVFVRRDGRAHFRLLETGIIGDTMDVEVRSGLQVGEEVISGPYQVLRTLREWDRVALDPKRVRAADKP